MNRSIKPIRVEGNIAYVPLTQGHEAIIDAEDVPLVSGRNWAARVERKRNGEVARVYALAGFSGKKMYIHRILMSRHDSKMDIDHIDRDCLNNKKSNLRFVSRSQNQMNQRISSANTSGYKGVSFDKRVQKWAASINANPITERLGFFNSAEQAAEAYAEASARLHGEHGRLR